MFFKKPLSVQNTNPRAFFLLIIWLLIAWILIRPLKGIGEYTYLLFGSLTNQVFQSISQSKLSLEELLNSKRLLKEQSKTISLLKIKIHYLENQVNEMKNLKSLLNLKEYSSYKTINANVVGRTADNWHKQIIIDKGTGANTMLGDAVLTPRGVVGQIAEVSKNTSIVQLISDPSYRIGCKIPKKNIIGILSPKTNSTSLLEFVPVGTNVSIGDLIVTSGISTGDLLPTYPSGHPLGKIKKVWKRKNKASDLYIEVRLFEDLNSLSDVLVFSPIRM